jgi:hypothetical protein
MAALFLVPASASLETPPPYSVENFKPVFAFFRDHRRPGDAVFVFPYAIEAVERYGSAYGLAPADYQVGNCSREDHRVFLRDVDRYRGLPRVWLLDGSVPSMSSARRNVEAYLSTIGVARESMAVPSERPLDPVSARLFDLSDPVRLEATSAEAFPLLPQGPLKRPCDERLRPLR